MADGTVNEFKTCLNGTFANIAHIPFIPDSLYVCIGTEFQIDGIRIINQRLRRCRTNQIREITAHLT